MIPYLAGFFDGEGCVTIGVNGSIQLRVINTSEAVLQEFVKHLGGSVKPRKQIVNKPQFHWSVYGPTAVEVAKTLVEHTLEKKQQLQTVINWYSHRGTLNVISHGRVIGQHRVNELRNLEIDKFRKELTRMKKESN